MRRSLLTPLAALAVVALAACGDAEPTADTDSTTTVAGPEEVTGTPLDDVEVTGDAGEQPTLEFDQPLEMTETATRLIEGGDGEAITEGAVVTFDFLFVNGRDGAELDSSFDGEAPEPAELVFEPGLMDGVEQGLEGVTAGSRVLVGIAPEDGLGSEDPNEQVQADDTLLFYAEILDVRIPLERAEGEPVEPADGLPTVELDDSGAPTITVPDTEPPTDLVVQPLIEGDGPVVEAGQAITVHYTGVTWETGEVFDSSWDRGSPATFDIGTGAVIPGWDEGLVGQTVGSQVLLVVPPDMGYPDGTSDGKIKAGDTIVFVVDILDAR